MKDDLRIVLIKENGNIISIFCSDDLKSRNVIEIDNSENINEIEEFYNINVKNDIEIEKNMDRHLFYLKDYLKNHFVDEFKSIGINPNTLTEDLVLYALLSELNNIVMINSDEHNNLLVVPYTGVNDKQIDSLEKSISLFDKNCVWSTSYDMHFENVEYGGKTFKQLSVGNEITGKLENFIDEIKKMNKTRKTL